LPSGQADRCYYLEEDVSDEDMRRTVPYYRETARPENRDWWAGARFRVEGRHWCFSLYRGADKGPFTVEDARTFTAVAPDLARIVALSEKFGDARLNFGVKLVQELNVAAILLDATGKALQMSSRAQELLGPDFHLIRGKPAARDPGSHKRLRSMLAAASNDLAYAVAAPVVISREGTPWLLAEALRTTEFSRDVFAGARIVLVLTDLAASPMRSQTMWSIVFGLTPAEARLANLIVLGGGIQHAADTLHISRETARSQLKSVFLKTRTTSQVELTALSARIR